MELIAKTGSRNLCFGLGLNRLFPTGRCLRRSASLPLLWNGCSTSGCGIRRTHKSRRPLHTGKRHLRLCLILLLLKLVDLLLLSLDLRPLLIRLGLQLLDLQQHLVPLLLLQNLLPLELLIHLFAVLLPLLE